MEIPRIVFKYSWIYDQKFKEWNKIYERNKKNKIKYPSPTQILKYLEEVKSIWKKYEKKILKELSRVSGLKWKEDKISCYVIGRFRPFSDPLTIPIYKKYPDYFIDVLVHELIHQLFTQKGNLRKSEKAWKYFEKRFKNESWNTRIHIPLHAIHYHIYLKFFNENKLKRDIKISKNYPEYKRSWEIVQKIGYEKILKEFSKRI
jgi:hypothetical protein